MFRSIVLLSCLLLFYSKGFAQEAGGEGESDFSPHRLTIMMANSHIPSANKIEGEKTVFIVPTWGINYDYWFSKKWAIGLHSDFILQKYKIEERANNEVIERAFPISVSLMGLFTPAEHWTIVFGAGGEFEKNESFKLFTIGLEYGIELPQDWELSFNLNYEDKIEVYNSWLFGIGFSKRLP